MTKLVNVFATICKCFRFKSKSKENDNDYYTKLQVISYKYNISILPLPPNFNISDLYPETNNVETWNIFIIGKDKKYVLKKTNNLNINIPESTIINQSKGSGILEFFDPIWDKTLQGKQLQFFMIYDHRTYFVNTYPYYNDEHDIIGASMFVRPCDKMPTICSRLSFENK
jgi:hypothetical protein